MKTNIKLKVTPEQSKAVQEICFKNGVDWDGTGKFYHINEPFIYIYELSISYDNKESSRYFRNHENKEVDADLFIRTNGTCEESIELVDNSSNSKSKEDMFKQYGFEAPDFECIILAKVKDEYVGYYVTNNKAIIALSWSSNGSGYIGTTYNPEYNLTPIKQPWYEICKFPMLVWDKDNNAFLLYRVDNFTTDMLNTFRPLSNNEIDQLKQDF